MEDRFYVSQSRSGGHALKYAADCIIDISRSLNKDGDDTIMGATTKVKTLKNKTYPPFKKGEFEIVFGKGIDKFEEIISLSADLDIIKRSGSWFSYGDSRLGQGLDNVKKIILDNPELYEELKEKVLESMQCK